MTMYNDQEAKKEMLKCFPKWMDIRKRPETSAGGKYLTTLSKEQDNIDDIFNKYVKSFFLKDYVGKEDTVLCQGALVHVGYISGVSFVDVNAEVTADPHLFVNDPDKYALHQQGYIVIKPSLVKDKTYVTYKHNGNEYRAAVNLADLWNIFDEYAQMSGLERYKDETNLELENRIIASFKNPTNSTKDGLKNAIVNSIINKIDLAPEEIEMDFPTTATMMEETNGVTLYDHLSEVNQDTARTKKWDQSFWEHNFKKTAYIPNEWDKQPKAYQDGTGQYDDFKVSLSSDIKDTETTSLEVYGYKKSKEVIDHYIIKRGIKKDIPLKLTRFRDELEPKDIEYKIVATNAAKLDANSIFVKTSQDVFDKVTYAISDIAIDTGTLTKKEIGNLSKGKYLVRFQPTMDYADFSIDKCKITENGATTSTSLLKDMGAFKLHNGVLQDTDILLHASQLAQSKHNDNMVDRKDGGIVVGPTSNRGEISFDITGMGGNAVKINVDYPMTDYTNEPSFVSYNGFSLENDSILHAAGGDSSATIVIDMECSKLAFELVKSENVQKQGAISIIFEVDGVIDAAHSGLFSESGIIENDLGRMRKVHVEIRKTGGNDVYIHRIEAARYKTEIWTDKGQIISSSMSSSLPIVDGTNTLHIAFEQYSGHSPILRFVHVGPSLASTFYETEPFSVSDKGAILDISSDCNATLFELDDSNKKTKAIENYKTAPAYLNESTNIVNIALDISDYVSVSDSSKPFKKLTYNNVVYDCIAISPNEEIVSITIEGRRRKVVERKSLADKVGMKEGDTLFSAANITGFVLKTDAGATTLINIPGGSANAGEYTLTYENIPNELQGCFVIDSQANIIMNADTYNHLFECSYITVKNKDEYIAYNTTKLVQPKKEHVSLIDTFSPIIEPNAIMVYKIEPIVNSSFKASALFEHVRGGQIFLENWSLSASNAITVSCEFHFNNEDEYQTAVATTDESYFIANSIALQDQIVLNGISYELARFIVSQPSNMDLSFANNKTEEDMYVENDGFNKLYYSNIVEISSITTGQKEVDRSKYELLPEAGIVIWKDDDLTGQPVNVQYVYRKPISLAYRSLDDLYEIADYAVDAYRPITSLPLKYDNVKNGDVVIADFDDVNPDKIVAKCNNNNFRPLIDNKSITVQLVSLNPAVLVHPGYYYDGGTEYYMFTNDHSESIEKDNNISMNNVDGEIDYLTFSEQSGNELRDTSMTSDGDLENLCCIDFNRDFRRIKTGSSFGEITACDTYQMWSDFNMDVSLVPSSHNLAIRFTPSNESAYAILDITKLAAPGETISFVADDSLHSFIAKEIKADEDNMTKSVFVQKVDGISKTSDGFYCYTMPAEFEDSTRYYLLVEGSGKIDDIVCRKLKDGESLSDHHRSNINDIGFTFEERAYTQHRKPFQFDFAGCETNNLAWNESGVIETAENIDWGVTRIANLTKRLNEFYFKNVEVYDDALYASSKGGTVESPLIELEGPESINKLFVKINDVIDGNMANFGVSLRSYSSKDDQEPITLGYNRKTNLLAIPPLNLAKYVQVVVEMDPGKVINSIELYARYAETATPLLIRRAQTGELISKVFDAAAKGNFRFYALKGEIEEARDVSFFIRGCRYSDKRPAWTEWQECKLDENLKGIGTRHIFQDYQFFQFKVEIRNPGASIKIDTIILEVA